MAQKSNINSIRKHNKSLNLLSTNSNFLQNKFGNLTWYSMGNKC